MKWRYFDPKVDIKLTCSCGCGRMEMDDSFMQELDQVREICKFPFHLTSAFRCPTYNAQVSSTGLRGPHTTGRAVDISAPSSTMRLRILEAGQKVGWSRFGIARTFIHCDNLTLADGFPSGVWPY